MVPGSAPIAGNGMSICIVASTLFIFRASMSAKNDRLHVSPNHCGGACRTRLLPCTVIMSRKVHWPEYHSSRESLVVVGGASPLKTLSSSVRLHRKTPGQSASSTKLSWTLERNLLSYEPNCGTTAASPTTLEGGPRCRSRSRQALSLGTTDSISFLSSSFPSTASQNLAH